MPANPKYLTASVSQRFAKVSAGFVGGYFLSLVLHFAVAAFLNQPKIVAVSMTFSHYLVWVALMFIPFLFKNGWVCWLIYLMTLLACTAVIHFTA